MPYFTNVGPRIGPILWRDGWAAIRALEPRDRRTSIGVALQAGCDEPGRSLWRLTVRDAEVPGLFVVVDREFRPAG